MAKKTKVESKDVKQKRIDDCSKEVNAVLDKYGCGLDWYVVMTPRGYKGHIKVISK